MYLLRLLFTVLHLTKQLIAEGSSKLASVPSGGAGAAAAGGAAAGGAAAAEEAKEEAKEEGTYIQHSPLPSFAPLTLHREGGVRRRHGIRPLRLNESTAKSHVPLETTKSGRSVLLWQHAGSLVSREDGRICRNGRIGTGVIGTRANGHWPSGDRKRVHLAQKVNKNIKVELPEPTRTDTDLRCTAAALLRRCRCADAGFVHASSRSRAIVQCPVIGRLSYYAEAGGPTRLLAATRIAR